MEVNNQYGQKGKKEFPSFVFGFLGFWVFGFWVFTKNDVFIHFPRMRAHEVPSFPDPSRRIKDMHLKRAPLECTAVSKGLRVEVRFYCFSDRAFYLEGNYKQ